MAVSQTDWLSWTQMSIWSRFSLFIMVLILVLIVIVSVSEYLHLNSVEHFASCVLPVTVSKQGSFPLTFIVPDEYMTPGITQDDLMDKRVSIQNAISTRNRFIQAILQNNIKLPILSSTTETIALQDVETRSNSCTICSALSLQKYLRENKESKLSVLDVVDSLYVYIIVSSTSDIFRVRDLKGKSISVGMQGTASNECLQTISQSLGWKQNRDYVVNEQIPVAESIRHQMKGRIPQVDATIIVDVYPSPLVKNIFLDKSNEWRLISLPNSPTSRWNVNNISYSQLNQKNNTSQINTLMTPLVMVSNTNYTSEDLLKFTSFAKNPFNVYGLQQVIDAYKIPLHPTSYKIYQSLGILS